MKKTVLLFVSIIVMMLASCQKSEAQLPKESQWITFTASCQACTLEIEEPTVNDPNNKRTFHFGGWISYTYENKLQLDSVKGRVYINPDNIRSQELTLSISESLKGTKEKGVRVVSSSSDPKRSPLSVEVKLKL